MQSSGGHGKETTEEQTPLRGLKVKGGGVAVPFGTASPHTILLSHVPLSGRCTCLAVARGRLRSKVLFFPNQNHLTLRNSTVEKIKRVTKHSALGQLLWSLFLLGGLLFQSQLPSTSFAAFLPLRPLW